MRDELVVSIEVAPFEGTVHNLTVEGDESYVLNGIVAHNCLCYKSAVLEPPEAFADRLLGWMTGGESWPEMDQYAAWLGTGREGLPGIMVGQRIADRLLTWLWGDQQAMDAAAGEYLLPGEQLAFADV
jgi:hypothetical protein